MPRMPAPIGGERIATTVPPGFALEWAFHKNMPLSARTGGPVKQVLYIHEHAAQELLNQFLELVQQGVDENFDNAQWDALFALVK